VASTRASLSGVDPVSYAAVAVLILLGAGLDAAIPLRRELRVDPAEALWAE